jgi:hypothetical protein
MTFSIYTIHCSTVLLKCDIMHYYIVKYELFSFYLIQFVLC